MTKFENATALSRRAVLIGGGALVVSVVAPIAAHTVFGLGQAHAQGTKPPLTPDQVKLLRVDNVVSEQAQRECRTLAAFGIEPATIEAIVPSYLWRFRKTGQFGKRMSEIR